MIKHKVPGVILVTSNGTKAGNKVIAEFIYDPTDPLAVEIIFDWTDHNGAQSTCWTVSRELLMRGSTSREKYGDGDMKLQFEGPGSNRLVLCMTPPEGHADVVVDHMGVIRFLNATCNAVRFGSEDLGESIDEALKEILGS